MVVFFFGGPEEIRTPDPHNANVVRSQLRYKPVLVLYCDENSLSISYTQQKKEPPMWVTP